MEEIEEEENEENHNSMLFDIQHQYFYDLKLSQSPLKMGKLWL